MSDQGVSRHSGFDGLVGRTVEESEPWWPPMRSAPVSAPNVVIILCDDLGFADIGPYGSEIETPNLDALAAAGIRFADFHSTPLCSPSRAVLLTGMNHHAVGVGNLAGVDHGFPGYRGRIAEDVMTAAELFRHNGYSSLMVGKWHLSLTGEHHDAGHRDHWPLQRGFDRFYGFMESGLTNLHHPNMLHEDNHAVPVDAYPDGYYFTDDITDRAIEMIRMIKASDPSRPFFLYCAHGAVHAPLMAKPDDIGKYRERYDAGWDKVRQERFERQLQLGIIPPGTKLPPRNSEPDYASPAWESLSENESRLFARQIEVFAAMVDNVDQNLGRLRSALEQLGELDNTIIIFTSDNGGSREGGATGTTQYFKTVGTVHSHLGNPDNVDLDVQRIDLLGGPRVMMHYPWGWGMVSNTPFRLHKGTTFAGGHRVPMIISWPEGVPARGEIRYQYAHLSDLLPSLAEMIGLEVPAERHGIPARQMTGTSFAGFLADADAPSGHNEQYYEMSGHRSFYREGWEAVTLHYPNEGFDDEQWHLFNVDQDPAQTTDLASQYPERVDELSKAWDEAAWTYLVYPIDDGLRMMRLSDPGSVDASDTVTLLRESRTLDRGVSARFIHGRSFTVTVHLEHRSGDRGVLFAHGDQGGGYAVYVDDDGSCVFAHNAYGAMTLSNGGLLADGTTQIRLGIEAEEGARWNATLAADGKTIAQTQGLEALGFLAPFEGIDVGIDRRSPVSWDVYERHGPFPYTGTLHNVTIKAGDYAPDAPQRIASERRAADSRYQ